MSLQSVARTELHYKMASGLTEKTGLTASARAFHDPSCRSCVLVI